MGRCARAAGDAALDRQVTLTLNGLDARWYHVRHRRLDNDHSNLDTTWERIGGSGRDWPDEEGWARLAESNVLEDLLPPIDLHADGGVIELDFALPMPAVSLIQVTFLDRPQT